MTRKRRAKPAPMPPEVRARLDAQLRAMMQPRTPRLPGETTDDYVDRLCLALGYTDGLSDGHPQKTYPDVPQLIFSIFEQEPPSVSIPPASGMFHHPPVN